jgi:predicted dehydrogenase
VKEFAVDRLHVGLLGAGWMGVVHARSWRQHAARGAVVAVADASADRARHLIDRHADGRARAYADWADLLADPAVDAVDICLPHHLHADAIIAAARAGKAILCEKPLCLSLAESARVGDALRSAGVTYMAAHNQLFQPSLIEARRLLADGALGRPYLYRSIEAGQNRLFRAGRPPVEVGAGESAFAWRIDPARSGGGELLDTGWHAVYRLLALSGERPTEVTALTGRYFVDELPAGVEDTALVLVRFASGALGEITTSWACGPVGGWQFEVNGERGGLAGSATRLLHQLHGWPQAAERPNERADTYALEVGAFLDLMRDGAPNPAPYEQAARALQLILAAYRAAETGRTVPLPEDPTRLDG